MAGRGGEYVEDTAHAGGVALPYVYARSRRRTLGLTVLADGTAAVRAPLRASLASIRAFVASRAAWIDRARASLHARSRTRPHGRYVEGEAHLYLGRSYRLEVSRGAADEVRLLPGTLRVTTRREPTEGAVERLLDRWYRERGERLFRRRIAYWNAVLEGDGSPPPDFRMRRMTSRWGSWSVGTRRVNLSLLLLRAPFACVDYVVLHELCHGRYRGHGPRFWALVGKHMPDWPRRRKALDAYAA